MKEFDKQVYREQGILIDDLIKVADFCKNELGDKKLSKDCLNLLKPFKESKSAKDK